MNQPLSKNQFAEDFFSWALQIATAYTVYTNVPYFTTAEGTQLQLDVYVPNGAKPKPRATLVFMHAGGWMEGSTRESWALWFLPFLQLGWVVINVGYRPSNVALAPAAVEDCLRALQWITRSASEYHVDPEQLVVGGLSAGGHLALTTAMIPAFMARHPEQRHGRLNIFSSDLIDASASLVRPIAIINWCGITDVADLVVGTNQQDFAKRWIGNGPNAAAIAEAVSPLSYVHPGVPPVITIHGDGDAVVPYSHATRLHEALSEANVTNELVTIAAGNHAFEPGALVQSYPRIMDFLRRRGLPTVRS